MQGYGGISCWLLGEAAELSREAHAPAEEIEVITNPPPCELRQRKFLYYKFNANGKQASFRLYLILGLEGDAMVMLDHH